MNSLFQRLMQKATQLTHRGDLQAATAAIQAALAGQQAEAPQPTEAAPEAKPATPPDVIDVAARELPSADAQDTPHAQPARNARPEGRFISGSHTGAGTGGQRDYKLYIPPAAGQQPLPLVVMLHGCKQHADDFAAGTSMNELARAHGFYVLYPEQSRQANPQRCWNWFKHSHQARGRGEPALLAGMIREVMGQHGVDAGRVYVAGLSAGGAMAAILADAYPELFAAVGVHSGLATGVAKDLPSAFAAMQKGPQIVVPAAGGSVPTIVFHGDADSTVHPGNAGHVIAANVPAGTVVESQPGQAPGGRRFTRELHRAPDGRVVAEHWVVHGSPHAWSGGSSQGSYTDPQGPDASGEMLRFFMAHGRAQ